MSKKPDRFIHSHQWRRIRAAYIAANPLCEECKRNGYTVAGEQVDHIVPRHRGGGHGFDNLQTLCVPCHEKKTAGENTVKTVARICVHGFPINIDGWGCDLCQ